MKARLLDPRFSLLPLKLLQWASIYWRLGLYKGDKLENWISEKLKAKGISVFGDLEQGKLKLIASDLSNGKMLVLPDDLNRYGLNPGRFSVARAVRMSLQHPLFFEPVKAQVTSRNQRRRRRRSSEQFSDVAVYNRKKTAGIGHHADAQ